MLFVVKGRKRSTRRVMRIQGFLNRASALVSIAYHPKRPLGRIEMINKYMAKTMVYLKTGEMKTPPAVSTTPIRIPA
jgi:hypothetical protein